jgi:hypothetical protein
MATNAQLTPERKRFAKKLFERMLREIRAEADRDGTWSAGQILAEIDDIIERG